MKNVLLVDDEELFIESLQSALEIYSSEFRILSAANGKDAIAILDSVDIDLMVTDLRMPVMDGFTLLAHMSNHFPSIPTIVLSAYVTPEAREKLWSHSPLQFIKKPVDLQELVGAIREGLKEETREEFVKGLALANFLQLIQMEQKSSVLEIFGEQKGHIGYFYFDQGDLRDAVCGDMTGDKAAIEMIAWDDVEIRLKDSATATVEKRVEKELGALIMQAMRLKKENQKSVEIDPSDPVHIPGMDAVSEELQSDFSENPGMAVTETDYENNNGYFSTQRKETRMDIQKLNEAVDNLKADVGDGLLATDIFGAADGQSIAGYNPQPKACALFNQLTTYLVNALKGSGFPGLGKYYILDLVDGNMVIVIPLGDYRWGMLIDGKKAQLGLLLNVVIPKLIDTFEEAITG